MVQFHRDVWENQAHVLVPLRDLVGQCSTISGKNNKKKLAKIDLFR